VNRRAFLRLSAASAAAVCLGGRGIRQAAAQAEGLAIGRQATVNTGRLNVRAGPSADQPIVAQLVHDARVDVLAVDQTGRWWRVADGQLIGYVDGEYLDPSGDPNSSNAFDVDLVIPYARQLTDVWCDPADIEMWIGYHDPSRSGARYDRQQAIWDWEIAHNAGFTVDQWNCSPFAVASAAHEWMPEIGFDHFHYDDAEVATRTMAWLLASPAFGEPSIALIWRGDHYVLVRGVRADSDPTRDPLGAQILGVYVADPNRGSASWLGEDRYVPIDAWLGEMLKPVSYRRPHTGVPGDIWQGRVVTVQRTWDLDAPSLNGRANATPADYATGGGTSPSAGSL